MPSNKGRRPDIIDVGGGGDGPQINLNFNPRWLVAAALVVIVAVWFGTGGPVYTVGPEEEGVVLTFGSFSTTTQPGLHFKMPWPVQTVERVKVDQVRRLEFGFRSRSRGAQTDYVYFTDDRGLLEEARMLTGDENIVNASMAVQYRVFNSADFLFNFREGDVEMALKDIGEAALRQSVGDHPIDDVLTARKAEIQLEVKDKMQELADLYGSGVRITEVQLQEVKPPEEVADAFQDVATAREEREKFINEAEAYREERLPQAEGEARRIVQQEIGRASCRERV